MSKKWIRIYCTDAQAVRYADRIYSEESDWEDIWFNLLDSGHTVTVTVINGSVKLQEYTTRMLV